MCMPEGWTVPACTQVQSNYIHPGTGAGPQQRRQLATYSSTYTTTFCPGCYLQLTCNASPDPWLLPS
jgi:hypothetical protein